jgi:hypothetical protein
VAAEGVLLLAMARMMSGGPVTSQEIRSRPASEPGPSRTVERWLTAALAASAVVIVAAWAVVAAVHVDDR